MIQQNYSYELDYWRKATEEKTVQRYVKALELMRVNELLHNSKSVIDLGCGPYGGIFHAKTFPVMVGIDPLWKQYIREFSFPKKWPIKRVVGDSLNFNYNELVDAIFSMNALDHSGNFGMSCTEIASHLDKGGLFLFHMHMRTKEQLNAGHRMVIDEKLIRISLRSVGLDMEWENIVDTCPFDNKNYRTYMGAWRK